LADQVTHTIYGIEHRTYTRDNYEEWNIWDHRGAEFFTSKEEAELKCEELNNSDRKRWVRNDGWNNGYRSTIFRPDYQVEEYELHGDISLLTTTD
jgi:hypothetical protein